VVGVYDHHDHLIKMFPHVGSALPDAGDDCDCCPLLATARSA
jgi:hypothetical protein